MVLAVIGLDFEVLEELDEGGGRLAILQAGAGPCAQRVCDKDRYVHQNVGPSCPFHFPLVVGQGGRYRLLPAAGRDRATTSRFQLA